MLNHTISTKSDRNNYLPWHSQINPILHGYCLHDFLEATPPSKNIVTPTGVVQNNPAFPIRHRQDQILLGWLRTSLSGPILAQVASAKTTSDLWRIIQRSSSATSKARLSELHRKLQNFSKGSLNCVDYIQQIQVIADELAFIGSPVSDDACSSWFRTGVRLLCDCCCYYLALTT